MKKLYAICALSIMLGGCDLSALPPSSIAPVCAALIGPIKYTSVLKSPMSRRFAAALLAMDLKQRNQVGVNLGCPLYR